MAVLKKIKSSTLMETLVATVLIVVIFMVASLILNNTFSNTIKNNTRAINARLNELVYIQKHDKLDMPYQEDYKNWNITAIKYNENNKTVIEFEAIQNDTKKAILKSYFEIK